MLVYLQMIDAREDRSKFVRVYERYKRLMAAVAYDILKDRDDAEDAVQEAFFAIAKNFSKISDVDSNKTRNFVVIIVRNKAINIYNANKARGGAAFDEAYVDRAFPPPGDGSVGDAMARLPGRYRDVLYLKYSCGYRSKEIGELLGLSGGAVRQELMRAREALRKELEKEGIEV